MALVASEAFDGSVMFVRTEMKMTTDDIHEIVLLNFLLEVSYSLKWTMIGFTNE